MQRQDRPVESGQDRKETDKPSAKCPFLSYRCPHDSAMRGTGPGHLCAKTYEEIAACRYDDAFFKSSLYSYGNNITNIAFSISLRGTA